MTSKSDSCVSSILSYSLLKTVKILRPKKEAEKTVLFFKTLYFRHFYDCVHEIHTAYTFISSHYMYEISYKLNDIFVY